MNTFNRFLVILIALAGICFSIGALLVVWALPGELAAALRQTTALLRDNALLLQALVTAFALGFLLIALLILIGEFSPQEPAAIRLSGVAGGGASVSVETVNERIRTEVEQIPGVLGARPHVKALRGAVEVLVDLRTDADAHLPTKADEVCQAVRRAAEERLGVKLKQVRVNFQPDRGRGSPPRPSGDIVVPGAGRPPPNTGA